MQYLSFIAVLHALFSMQVYWFMLLLNQMLIALLKEEIEQRGFFAHSNIFFYQGTNETHLNSHFYLTVLQIRIFAFKPAADNANNM